MTHGDSLPDTDSTCERVFVEYPRSETEAERAARIKRGLPRPTVSFVVSKAKPGKGFWSGSRGVV